MIRRPQARYLAGAVGKISSPELTQYGLLFSVCSSPVLPQWNAKVILPTVQVAGYTKAHIHPWPIGVVVGWLCCAGIVWESVRETSSHNSVLQDQSIVAKQAEMIMNEYSLTRVDSVHASWYPLSKKQQHKKCRGGMIYWTVLTNPCMWVNLAGWQKIH